MAKFEKTKSEYLQYLEQDISDELDIASSNSYNTSTSEGFAKFKEEFFNKESFDDFAKRILDWPEEDTKLFGPAMMFEADGTLWQENDENSFEWDLDIKRLKTLVEVSQNFLENLDVIRKTDTYKKLKLLIPDKDVTLLALVVEEMKMYAQEMLDIIKRNQQYLLAEFASVIRSMKNLAKDIIESKSRLEVVSSAYELESILSDYFETLVDRTFEWDQEQINRANWFVNLLTDFEANWYFLLLIREETIVREGLTNNPNVNSTTDFYNAKQELLAEGNVMKEAGIAYNGKVTKNHKK